MQNKIEKIINGAPFIEALTRESEYLAESFSSDAEGFNQLLINKEDAAFIETLRQRSVLKLLQKIRNRKADDSMLASEAADQYVVVMTMLQWLAVRNAELTERYRVVADNAEMWLEHAYRRETPRPRRVPPM